MNWHWLWRMNRLTSSCSTTVCTGWTVPMTSTVPGWSCSQTRCATAHLPRWHGEIPHR
ncbi:MAG: hypothetical protein L6W00_25390 [Lentisphaeria bacterium]|nr:MAG: hypothetical protein L6W00_25390 [Lentisphaeria bacterium]